MKNFAILIFGTLAAALPAPQSGVLCPSCDDGTEKYACAVVTDRTNVTGTAWQGGESVRNGGELQLSESHTFGSSWAFGADLGLDLGDAVSIGASVTYTESVSDATAEGATDTCPDGDGTLGGTSFQCAMIVTPTMTQVTGYSYPVDSVTDGNACPDGHIYLGISGDFQFQSPNIDTSGNGVVGVGLCTCQNTLIADPNGVGPSFPCPWDCGIVET